MMSFLDSAQSAPSDKLAPPPDFEKYIAPAREQREKVGGQLEQSEKESDAAVAKFNEIGKNKPPEFQPVPSPDVVETSPAKVWGSAAMLLAAVGSAFTRRPMVTAMNAAAKTITGFQQGDLEATQQGYDSWKIANENAIKAHQFQIDQYKEALDVAKEDVVAGSAKMRALAAQFHDAYMLEASQTRDYQAMLDKYNGEAEQLQRFQATLPRLNTLANQATQLLQYRDNFIAASRSLAEAKKSNDPAKVQLAQDAFDEAKAELGAFVPTLNKESGNGAFTPDAISLAATEYRLTGKMPSLGLGNASARIQIINAAAQQAKEMGMSPSEIVAGQAGVSSDTASLRNITRISDSATAYENTAMKNFDRALSLAKRGGIPTDMGPWINRWVQTGETGTGDPNVPPYVAALITGANEYAKVMSGSTGAQGSTVDSRKEAAELFSPALTYEQISGVINVAKQDMDNKKSSYRDMVSDIKERISGEPKADTPPPDATSNNLPKITTKAEFDKLPKGAHYIEPDGREYVKP